MNHRVVAFVIGLTFLAVPAFAENGTPAPTPKKHHCMLKGVEIQATKKECLNQGGSWQKTAAPAGSTAPAPKSTTGH